MSVLVVAVLLIVLVSGQDPNACGQWPTCEICLQHNSCGWCAENVLYEDGSTGPHCAGKPQNPDHPPPGFKKWTCPKDYQNKACFGYVCDQNTFQCVSSGAPGMGVPLAQCTQECVPPTYICNSSTWTCDKAKPGVGTDLPSCQAACQDDLYVCTKDGTCEKSEHGGGQPLADCQTSCQPSNVTPVVIIGDYRGLQVNQKYTPGEWTAKLTESSAVIYAPDGSVFAQGKVQTFQSQLWLQTDDGTLYKGIYALDNLPELSVLTWALAKNREAPEDFDTAMRGDIVLVLGKCLNAAICQFNVKAALADFDNKISRRQATVDDPCMQYPDCQSCVDAPSYCGWCSVSVVYNGTIPGRNCAGINKTVSKLPFNCTGSFSIQSCMDPSTTSASTGDSTSSSSSDSTGSGTGTGTSGTSTGTGTGTTGGADMYTCLSESGTCVQQPGGTLSKQTCEQQCILTPVVPPLLQNKVFRGLDIEINYMRGEWTAAFSNTSVTVTPPNGKSMVGKVTSTSSYLTVFWNDGTIIQTLWQLQGGPATEFLTWAWGAAGGSAPASFDEAMNTQGEKEFWFVACPTGKPTYVCNWNTVPKP